MVYGVKVFNVKNGRRYGPYPKEPDLWYLYESFRAGDRTKKRFIGKGPLPKSAIGVVQEFGLNKVEERTAKKGDRLQALEALMMEIKLVEERCREGYRVIDEFLENYGSRAADSLSNSKSER